ncbi:uncharacterized protein F4822DRAFT_170655 [Hypoxylon trugodes]|uniref:uncharacterized protein n=1 Tax=Hypoxylon trugodes TaxID=326681 RepID=UPI0021966A00|nr:uncharacterized protein F4822DRAFT_170655 [Hypoxylon trugodes]KAI1391031.1 hypothetical protein F4822DRAFT_170655 [Hypoxylon trugodes]
MGRLEPLTSRALGRSPYDGFSPGEGEEDPHEPEKQYDETGRIVNPRTKEIIKDVIRAHNEVMQVIGVAEPDNGGISAADLEMAKQYREYEGDTGRTLNRIGTGLTVLGTWGVHNIRRRVLSYQRGADISFVQLLASERNNHSFLQLCLAGYPCHLLMHVLCSNLKALGLSSIRQNPWLRGASEYVRFHLELFLTMQRLDMISPYQLLPGPKFLIPFSSSSPFSAPPLPDSLDARSVISWTGKLIANLAPYAAFYACGHLWKFTRAFTRLHIRKRLPRPVFCLPANNRITLPLTPAHRQTVPESPTLGPTDREIRHQDPEPDASASVAIDVQSGGETIPVGSVRRQSTYSRGPDDYGTDEEDLEMVNPTLISFDVDTSESPDPPTGVWSAELRPSYAGDSRQQPKEAPRYVVNPLTTLPSMLASETIAKFATNILFILLDIHIDPIVARALAFSRGLPYSGTYNGGFLAGLTWRSFFNIIQLDLTKLLISGEVWIVVTVLSQWLHITDEEWKEMHKEERQETLSDVEQDTS